MSKVKCIVNHKNLFLAVDGKLQQMEKGEPIEVDEKTAQRHLKNGNLLQVSNKKPVKVGKTES